MFGSPMKGVSWSYLIALLAFIAALGLVGSEVFAGGLKEAAEQPTLQKSDQHTTFAGSGPGTTTPSGTALITVTGTPTQTSTGTNTPTRTLTNTITRTTTATPTFSPSCGRMWQWVNSPNASSNNNTLSAVTAISQDDIWAVGKFVGT